MRGCGRPVGRCLGGVRHRGQIPGEIRDMLPEATPARKCVVGAATANDGPSRHHHGSSKGDIMTLHRTAPGRALVLSALLLSAACAAGDDGIMRQAREECAARGLEPASAAYGACVDRRSEELYAYWARVLKTQGD